MLQEQRIGMDGVYTYDKVETAIKRLQMFEALALEYSPEGYYLCDSGGKDSSVIKELAIMAGVKHGVHHNHTTLDHPETVYFVRREKTRYESMGIPYTIHYPEMSFPRLMRKKKMPPTRLKRYCCEVLKEYGGQGCVCVTGVRWSESVSRSKQRGVAEVLTPKRENEIILNNDNDESRKEFETCQIKGKRVINPIIDWTNDDVWEFIDMRQLVVNPLYAMGYKRVGCVGCPMSSKVGEELEAMPKYKANWIRWFGHLIDDAKRDGRPVFMESAEDYYNFWVSGKALPKDDGQISFDDEEKMIEFKKAVQILKGMCVAQDDGIGCDACPLHDFCNVSLRVSPDETEDIFAKWVAEHPEKRIAGDFFEKHPKAKRGDTH